MLTPAPTDSRLTRTLASFAVSRGRRAVIAWFLVTVIATLWIWEKALFTAPMGEGDWPREYAIASFVRKAFVDFGEIPGWSRRYVNGWAPHLQIYTALPETPLFSPFLPVLLFVPHPWSYKVYIALHLLLGIAGIFVFARRLALRPPAASIASLAIYSSGHLTAHVSLGHDPWMMSAYIPWALFFAHKTWSRISSLGIPRTPGALFMIGLTSLSLSLIIASGASHISIYAILLVLTFIFGIGIREKRTAAALVLILIVAALVFLFSAARLVPTLVEYADYVSPHRDPIYSFRLAELVTNFLVTVPEGGWPWERAAYMGALIVALAAVGTILRLRKPVIAGLLITLAVGHTLAALPPWEWLFKLPVFKTQGVHARFILLSIFAIALLAAFAVNGIVTIGARRKRRALAGVVVIAVVAGAVFDLRSHTEWWFTNFRNPYVDIPVALDAPHVVAPPERPARVTAKTTRVFQVETAPGPAMTLVFPELSGETKTARWETEGGATIRAGVRPLTVDVGENATAFTLRIVPTKFFQGVAISLSSIGAWLLAVFLWRRRARKKLDPPSTEPLPPTNRLTS